MNCETVRFNLIEAARGRELSGEAQKLVFAHTAECRSCERLLENERALSKALAAVAAGAPEPPARVEYVLRRSLGASGRKRPIAAFYVGALAAAVAVLLIAISLRGPDPSKRAAADRHARSSEAETHKADPPVTAASVGSPEAANASTGVARIVRNTRRPADVPAPRQTASSGTGGGRIAPSADPFIALPYAQPLSPEEPSEIVRVGMRRGSLLAIGFPVAAGSMNEQIQAEVLIGMDGTARAIRVAP
jgi:hypothetical protein